jgi:hypothetical protein
MGLHVVLQLTESDYALKAREAIDFSQTRVPVKQCDHVHDAEASGPGQPAASADPV